MTLNFEALRRKIHEKLDTLFPEEKEREEYAHEVLTASYTWPSTAQEMLKVLAWVEEAQRLLEVLAREHAFSHGGEECAQCNQAYALLREL